MTVAEVVRQMLAVCEKDGVNPSDVQVYFSHETEDHLVVGVDYTYSGLDPSYVILVPDDDR